MLPSRGKHLGWIVAIMLLAQSSFGLVFAPGASFNVSGSRDSGQFNFPGHESSLVLDLRLLSPVKYKSQILKGLAGGAFRIERGSTASGDLQGFALGPAIAHDAGSWNVVGTWHLFSERRYDSSGVESKLAQGSGVELEAAWVPELRPGLGFGPRVVYRYMRWKQARIGNSAEGPASVEISEISPSVAFWFRF
jgi:hypothetical protein